MWLSHKDGSLRFYSGSTGSTYYYELLFTDANFNAPMERKRTEERLIMDRGVMDSNAHYVEGGDDPVMESLPLTVSCKIADTTSGTSYLEALLFRPGSTVNNRTVTSTKGWTANVSGTSNPAFADSGKRCLNVECFWDGTVDLARRWSEVHFPPGEQTITEAEDGITLNLNGQVYGDISKVTCFTLKGSTDITS